MSAAAAIPRLFYAVLAGLFICCLPSQGFSQQYGSLPGKYNPGHYIALTFADDYSDMLLAKRPGVTGFQRRYYWKDLEPTQDEYDFSAVREDLNRARDLGLQLVVMVADKSFEDTKPTPPYGQDDGFVAKNRKGGYTALRWRPAVLERFKLLLTRIGAEFDSHPAFEGVAITESALSLNDNVLDAYGYTPVKYRKALVDTLLTAAEAMPNSRVFWYMNYIVRDMSQLNIVAKNVAPAGIVMAGPDVLPDDESLQTIVYPMYDKWEGRMALGIAAQYDSYAHLQADTSQKSKYWTMWQIFRYARDELHSNYIFWNNMTWKYPQDSYTVENAYPVIEKNPSFNETWVGEFVDSDADGLSDISEAALGTNPAKKDTDGDGLIDGKEVNVYLTDPLNRDTDGGGKQDKLEIAENRDPLDPADDSGVVPDSDRDGLSDALEATLGTDPDKWDTDGEGLSDGVEIIRHGTDPLDRNTDKDLLTDRIEIEYKLTDPLNPDTDADGLSDGEEAGAGGLGTNPLKADTDGGGTPDGVEVRRGTNPLKRWDDN